MSPRAPSTDPRIIRAALAYHQTHSMNATADHFGVQHHTIKRWIQYRAERHPEWPTDQDIAIWDAKASRREKSAKWKRRYVHRLHLNGGRPLMQPAHGTIRRLQALCAIGWTDELDENAVLRAMGGDRTIALSKAERTEVTRRLRARGWSSGRIEQHTGLKAERYAQVAA